MKNKILLTAAMALIGIFTFSLTAEAQYGRGGRDNHKHVTYNRGQRVVVWHNNYNQCGNQGYGNRVGHNRMCAHMNSIYRGGQCGNAVVRCNHRGCNMFGMTYRNGQYYGGQHNQGGGRGNGHTHQGGRKGGKYNKGNGRGNNHNNDGGRGKGRNNGRGNGRR